MMWFERARKPGRERAGGDDGERGTDDQTGNRGHRRDQQALDVPLAARQPERQQRVTFVIGALHVPGQELAQRHECRHRKYRGRAATVLSPARRPHCGCRLEITTPGPSESAA